MVHKETKRRLSTIFPVSDDADIFLVQDSVMALSTRMSDLEWGRSFVFGSLITSRTALHENMSVAFSRILIVTRSGYLGLRCSRALNLMARVYSEQCQNLSSGQHALHHVRHASPGTIKS